ncbi:efflux RND transporter periplasmic adaptor subunit [Pendulispora brunnea]|uniref:Efflux RND transporter periplasmic adaptor subunit n=1 Tax=Pendulispora brunnea TaxID=2905690 RepID=A0ABZ2KB27_9BACT
MSVGGCKAQGAEHVPSAAAALPAPPYEIVSKDDLRVRHDLYEKLVFATATQSDVEAIVQGFGRVAFAPNGSYAVRVPFSGFVLRVHVAVGDDVRIGQPLATLRSSDLAKMRADARKLQAVVDTERDTVGRIEKLVPEGAASGRELIESKGRLSAATAELQGIREALAAASTSGEGGEEFVLRASAPGRVLSRQIAPGERVDPSSDKPIFLIGNPNAVVVRAAFPERDAPLLREGSPCSVCVPALGSGKIAGSVVNLVHALDMRTHTVEASCAPSTSDPRLSADMTAKVDVTVRGTGVLVVPRSAVLLRRDARVVFVATGDEGLSRRTVDLGAAVGDNVQIVKGVQAGERVVTANAVLFDGELDRVL